MFRSCLFASVLFSLNALSVSNDLQLTSNGIRDLGFKLYRSLSKTRTIEPIAISPLSISEALSLAALGANGKTKLALEKLWLSDADMKKGKRTSNLVNGMVELRAALKKFAEVSKGSFEFSSANSLWANSRPNAQFEFSKRFLALARDNYGASVRDRNFSATTTLKEVNNWVSTETDDKINTLISKLRHDDIAIILNAVYAKGAFKNHFGIVEEGDYRGGPKSKPSRATYMTKKEDSTGYVKTRNLEVFSFLVEEPSVLEEGSRNQIALDVIVPVDGDLEKLSNTLSGSEYMKLVDGLRDTRVELTLPASKVEQGEALGLKQILVKEPFELSRPFDESLADFKPLGRVTDDRNIYINDVLTKTFYEVTPFGFEAAAATAVIFSREFALNKPPQFLQKKIDGPALHVIRHVPTGTPLFIVNVDRPVVYTVNDLKQLVEQGYKSSRRLIAKTDKGTIRVTSDEKRKGPVLALTAEDGRIIEVYKDLDPN